MSLGEAANLIASCWTGAAVIALTNPLDCLKQKWQVAQGLGEETSMATFTRDLLHRQGLWRGLWRPGMITNTAACTVTAGTRLGIYPRLRDGLSSTNGSVAGKVASGFVGGALGYVAAAPLFFATRVAHVSEDSFP